MIIQFDKNMLIKGLAGFLLKESDDFIVPLWIVNKSVSFKLP